MYGLHVVGYVGIAILVSAISSPTIFGEDLNVNIVSKSSEDITQLLLKSNAKNETNYIFSPFGYSVILGILAEGTRGDTKQELDQILHLPQDTNLVRENYRTALQRFQEKSALNVPEFRNYFYVYKNFTVNDAYKAIVLENYFTEVKSVDRPSYDDLYETTTSGGSSSARPPTTTETIVGKPTTGGSGDRSPTTTDTTTEKPSPSIDKHPIVHKTVAFVKKTKQRRTVRKASSEVSHQRIKRLAKRFLGIDLDSTKSEVSGLSANRLQSENITGILSRMIVFNGLYFKGYWKIPFQYKEGEELFHKSSTETVTTKMMYAVGQFNVGRIPELSSVVLCLPYKGERYSFVIILPEHVNGSQKLINNLNNVNLADIHSKLESRHVQISVPAFEFNTISYLKEPLKSIGIKKIFTEEADFNGLNKEKGLFVDDVVQLVTIKLHNEAGTPNFLTASSVQTRTVTEKFTVDRPFVFFVQDHKDDLIIAAGKLYDPTKQENTD